MKKALLFLGVLAGLLLATNHAGAKDKAPDTVKVGVYITSIHDIDFKQKEYAIDLWLWLTYKNAAFDFVQNMEIPQAKSFTKSFSTVDTSNGETYLLMKLQCVMKDSWKINHFPFDRQKLRFSLENSQFDSKALIFVADTFGQHFDPRYVLSGWMVHDIAISVGTKAYETTFGDRELSVPHTEYSSFKVKVSIDRDVAGLFWKMFLGMYIAFLIAYMCFYIHADSIDSRFGLSVGALFAVVGNKYIVDDSLPESNTFTLVDGLHGVTLAFVLGIIICNAISLKLVKQQRINTAKRFNRMAAWVCLLAYLVINAWLITNAAKAN